MSVHKRGDRWVCRVYLGRDDSGKPKWTFTTHRTQKEAKQAEADTRAKLHRGSYVEPNRLTVAAYLRNHPPTL